MTTSALTKTLSLGIISNSHEGNTEHLLTLPHDERSVNLKLQPELVVANDVAVGARPTVGDAVAAAR